jgi:ribonucleoside-diphosphate reductase alpha chain
MEQFLQPYDSCRLFCLNLFSFVKDPFTDKAEIDFDKLYKMSYEMLRLADDLVDLELEYIDRIIEKIKNDPEDEETKRAELNLWYKVRKEASAGRRCGNGITALGDVFAALGVKYDSSEALEIAEQIMRTKMEAELDCSIDLSILRGPFESWDMNKEFATSPEGTIDFGMNSFYQHILDTFPKQAYRMAQYGRRNISWSTVAPTGTVSLMANNCTSGIEPLFQPYYTRRRKINPNDENTRVDFVDDSGDKWQEYFVLHPYFKEWCIYQIEDKIEGVTREEQVERMSKEGIQSLFRKSPWYKSCANDIDWKKRVEMQSVIQRYTSNSISSTVNLPKETTAQEVSDIYMYAWKKGLKGITAYRESSREGVLINKGKESNSEEFKQHDAPKRPEALLCKASVTTIKGEPFTVFVGLLDDKPYEVFCLQGRDYFLGNSSEGFIFKHDSGKYVFNNDNADCPILTDNLTDEQAIVTRLLSTSLRHGTNIKFIVQQLNKTHGDITSFSKAISRVLSQYIKNTEDMKVVFEDCETPEECEIVYEQGCVKCNRCGKSKC